MWLNGEEAEVGRRIHHLIGVALEAERDGIPFDLIATARAMFRTAPMTRGSDRALCFRCTSTTGVYLHGCRPAGWVLAGREVPVGSAVADLVWEHPDGRLVIDEVKTGRASAASPTVADQLARLAAGATAEWGARFVGVRLVPLATLDDVSFHDAAAGQLVDAPLPDGMGVMR